MTVQQLNYLCQRAYRGVRGLRLVLYAMVMRKRFYCAALSGESSYNICINSDMTVSCNCQDFDGSGYIGDLRTQNLEEVFASYEATNLRKKLASGRLPIHTCAGCFDLVMSTREEAYKFMERWSVCSKGIMVENTIVCPYNCSACYRGLVVKHRKQKSMSLDDISKVSGIIRKHNIGSLYFFNLGETFAHPGVSQQISIIRETNPNLIIFISTNGLLLNTDDKRASALLSNRVRFSIDGIDDKMIGKYQRGGSFAKAYKNMKELVDYRNNTGNNLPEIHWKYVLFNWNDKKDTVLKAIDLARNAGVDSILFCPTISPFYGVSWRYHLDPFYKNLGEPDLEGRIVRLTNQ